MSIADMTEREIAAKSSWGETKQAEGKAVAAQDAALAALAEVEATLALECCNCN
jgi:hypothetical protein